MMATYTAKARYEYRVDGELEPRVFESEVTRYKYTPAGHNIDPTPAAVRWEPDYSSLSVDFYCTREGCENYKNTENPLTFTTDEVTTTVVNPGDCEHGNTCGILNIAEAEAAIDDYARNLERDPKITIDQAAVSNGAYMAATPIYSANYDLAIEYGKMCVDGIISQMKDRYFACMDIRLPSAPPGKELIFAVCCGILSMVLAGEGPPNVVPRNDGGTLPSRREGCLWLHILTLSRLVY